MPITVTRMTHANIPGAVTCIQEAFADDPYSKWVFNDRKNFNQSRNTSSLSTRCRWGIAYGLFYVARDLPSDRILGVAMWLPPALATPSPPATWADWLHRQSSAWFLWIAQIATNAYHLGRGGLNVRRYWAWKAAQAQAQCKAWDDARGYYFCNIITVLPEAQGRGIGRMLCEEVTRVADAEGRSCYLESSRREPNVSIYEKMGFRLCDEMLCSEGEGDQGIRLYCMKRAPQAMA